MTTIAASIREGVMSSDSRVSDGIVWSAARKIERIGPSLVGWAGDTKHYTAALRWWKAGKRGKAPAGNVTLLILSPEGLSTWSPEDGEQPVSGDYWAIGSGGPIAIALMMAGHTVRESVEFACRVDANSGGDVVVESL